MTVFVRNKYVSYSAWQKYSIQAVTITITILIVLSLVNHILTSDVIVMSVFNLWNFKQYSAVVNKILIYAKKKENVIQQAKETAI